MGTLDHRRIRVNITCEGTLLTLSESGAVVELPSPQPPNRQTTLTIDANGETLYLPARILSSIPQSVPGHEAGHCVALEFLALSHDTAAAVCQLLSRN